MDRFHSRALERPGIFSQHLAVDFEWTSERQAGKFGMMAAGMLRVRRQTAGPENELVDNAMRAELVQGKTSSLVLREPALGAGFPDLVSAFPTARNLRVERPPLDVDHLRLLQFLWWNEGATTLSAVQTFLRLSSLDTLRQQADGARKGTFDETVDVCSQQLVLAEQLTKTLAKKGIRGQDRDFGAMIVVNRAALAMLVAARRARLGRKW